MPFVLKHRITSEIFACRLVNVYSIPYYGVKYWDDPSQAEAEAAAMLKAHGAGEEDDWTVAEIGEHQLKLCNVRLANDENRKIFMDKNGGISAVRPS